MQDTIHLLINDIGSRSLRELTAAQRVSSVDDFLEVMQHITAVSGESSNKTTAFAIKPQTVKNSSETTEKDINIHVYCRAKGHVREDC